MGITRLEGETGFIPRSMDLAIGLVQETNLGGCKRKRREREGEREPKKGRKKPTFYISGSRSAILG